jgi:truncated hemoglobin YjbI
VDEVPLGMSEGEFEELRARHDAGEITVSEAQEILAHMEEAFEEIAPEQKEATEVIHD